MRHTISDKDTDAMTGVCAVCGPVALVRQTKSGGRYTHLCANKRREDKRRQGARYRLTKGHVPRAQSASGKGERRRVKEALLAAQEYKCAICANEIDMDAHLDHNHACCESLTTSCGKCYRGLLCRTCNVGIGMLRDNADLLEKAAAYLRN